MDTLTAEGVTGPAGPKGKHQPGPDGGAARDRSGVGARRYSSFAEVVLTAHIAHRAVTTQTGQHKADSTDRRNISIAEVFDGASTTSGRSCGAATDAVTGASAVAA